MLGIADTSTSLDVVGSAVEHSGLFCDDIASFMIYKTVNTASSIKLHTEITKIRKAEDTNDRKLSQTIKPNCLSYKFHPITVYHISFMLSPSQRREAPLGEGY